VPLQRERRRTPLHNIVVINFLIARSPSYQRGRLHSYAGSLLAAGKPARINLPFCRYREVASARVVGPTVCLSWNTPLGTAVYQDELMSSEWNVNERVIRILSMVSLAAIAF
jgi:hypothetical protein